MNDTCCDLEAKIYARTFHLQAVIKLFICYFAISKY